MGETYVITSRLTVFTGWWSTAATEAARQFARASVSLWANAVDGSSSVGIEMISPG